MKEEYRRVIKSVIIIGIGIFIFLGLVSYDPGDLGLINSRPNEDLHNRTGIFGAYLSWMLFQFFGWTSYLIPILMVFYGSGSLKGKIFGRSFPAYIGIAVLFWACASAAGILSWEKSDSIIWSRGGAVGYFSSAALIDYLGLMGAWVVTGVLLILSLLLASEFQIISIMRNLGSWTIKALIGVVRLWNLPGSFKRRRRKITISRPEQKTESVRTEPERVRPEKIKREVVEQKPLAPAVTGKKEEDVKEEVEEKKVVTAAASADEGRLYQLPGLDLLEVPPPIEKRKIRDDMEKKARILEETLEDFGIDARVVHIEQGPVITSYELEPAAGVRVHRITSLNAEIALAMKAESVRIVAPIPGKSRVGVEVPNSTTALVYAREILESKEFKDSPSRISFALGKNIAGEPIVTDLAEMPHLLIAGTTGSGKTACVNSIITSILFRANPEEVKFILVDPKMVELASFNGLPHLLCPVVTKAKKVSAALNWLVNEMEGRFELFARTGTRNIELYNKKVSPPERIPYIVIVIDELADLMAVAANEIENAITRLAQLSRAVGIHIILATQRPSVDVVTGIIKANFPARISFQVASKVDSRTVLDMIGADKLLGKGDMLFLEPGSAKPIRAQGTLTQDPEIEKVVKFIKSQRETIYKEEITKTGKSPGLKSFEQDEFYEEAKRLVIETGQASVSMLQRRLGLGYQRAARLIDTMEETGIVGPYRGSRPREVLVKRDGENQAEE